MDQDEALGQVQPSTGFSHLALDHLRDREGHLRVACDFKVIANSGDPDVRRHQRKLLSNQLLRCISNGLEKLDGTDCKEQWAGWVSLLQPGSLSLNQHDVHAKEAESPDHSPIRRKVTYGGPVCGPP